MDNSRTRPEEADKSPEMEISSSPRLIAPKNDVQIDSDEVQFTWEEVDGARAYWIQVADDEEFQRIVFDAYIGPSQMLTLKGFLPVDGSRLHWRMRTLDEQGWQEYGKHETFRVIDIESDDQVATAPAEKPPASRPVQHQDVERPAVTRPDVPAPASPVGEAPVDGSAATFTWQTVPGSNSYYLQVANDPDFDQILFDAHAGDTNSLTVHDVLPEDGSILFWRVRKDNGRNEPEWSHPAVFKATTSEEARAYQDQKHKVEQEERERARAFQRGMGTIPVEESSTSARQAALTIGIMIVSFIITLFVIYQLGVSTP